MRPIRILLATAFLFTMGAAAAFACECPRGKSSEEEFAWADVVAVGEVVNATTNGRDRVVTLKPTSIFKGQKTDSVVVVTADAPQGCGFQFQKGSSYLVYAATQGFGTKSDTSLRTSKCSRTRPVEYATDELGEFGDKGWSPVVNGIRGRITFLPAYNGGLQYYRVRLELENRSDVGGQRSIRFEPDRVELEIVDGSRNVVPTVQSLYSRLSPIWKETLIPYRGAIKFDISFPGTGLMRRDRPVIDLGPSKVWPLDADSFYIVRAKLIIPSKKGDHPVMDWSGTLEMPMVILRPFAPPANVLTDPVAKP